MVNPTKTLTVITFGTFDVVHVGHLRILQSARALGDRLVVGVSSDQFSYQKKGKYPVYSEEERCEIVTGFRCVDEVFLEESFDRKREYIQGHCASVMVMGSDWEGKFDEYSDLVEVVYLPRTPSISTTEIIEKIRI